MLGAGIQSTTDVQHYQELTALAEAFEGLLTWDYNFLERVGRDKTVEVNGKSFDLRQNVTIDRVYGGDSEQHYPLKLEDDEELLDGSWFRQHISEGAYEGTSSLSISTSEIIDNCGGSNHIPNVGAPTSKYSSVRLLDPFENRIVQPKEKDYQEKWNAITSWVLDQLDDGCDLYMGRSWVRNPLDRDADSVTDFEAEIGYFLYDVSKYRSLQSLDPRLADRPVIFDVLFSWLSDDPNQNNIFRLLLNKSGVELLDLDPSQTIEVGEEYPVLDINDFDPDLLRKITKLVRVAV